MPRIRIFDLNTPWFWFTIFYNIGHYGKPIVEVAIWEPHKWKKFWLHIWQREFPIQEMAQKANFGETDASKTSNEEICSR